MDILLKALCLLRILKHLEKYLDTIDENYDEGSTITQKADIFIESDRKKLIRTNEVIMVQEVLMLLKR